MRMRACVRRRVFLGERFMIIDNHVAKEINTPDFIDTMRKQLNKPTLSNLVTRAESLPWLT